MVACNTATAAALDDVAAAVDVPVIGVIEPAVRAAMKATRNGRVGPHRHAGHRGRAARTSAPCRRSTRTGRIEMIAQACPQFVEFVERGDTTSPELQLVAESYLALCASRASTR